MCRRGSEGADELLQLQSSGFCKGLGQDEKNTCNNSVFDILVIIVIRIVARIGI